MLKLMRSLCAKAELKVVIRPKPIKTQAWPSPTLRICVATSAPSLNTSPSHSRTVAAPMPSFRQGVLQSHVT